MLPDAGAWLIWLLETISANADLRGAIVLWSVQVLGYLLMVPTSILSVAAGCAYGLPVGLLVGQAGHLFGCLPPFLASRRLIRRRVAAFAAKRPLAHGIMAAVDEQPFTICCLLRMSPAPLPLSYILGLTSIPELTYLGATMLGAFPQLFFSVYLGTFADGMADVLKGKVEMPWQVVALGGCAALVVSYLISSAAQKKINEATAAALRDETATPAKKAGGTRSPAKAKPKPSPAAKAKASPRRPSRSPTTRGKLKSP